MISRMKVAIVAVIAALMVAVAAPNPASAIDAGEIAIYSAIGVGAAIVIVLVATYFTRDEESFFLVEPPQYDQLERESRVKFGTECIQPDGTAALLCW